jgi:exopolysaccharide biosynthesis protein
LPELQDKLIALGAIDAYNLDGGGSSSLVFNGQVINKPSDGKLRPLPTHFLFFK